VRTLVLCLAVGVLVITGCHRSVPCSVGIESTVDSPIEDVAVWLDQVEVVQHVRMSRLTPTYMHIGVQGPARVATVQWTGEDGRKRQQVIELAAAKGCTEGMLVLRFVDGTDGIAVEKSMRTNINQPLPGGL